MAKRRRHKSINTLVDIVIPVHNRFDLLAKCIKAIPEAAGKIKYAVYIYDNASEKEEADEFYKNVDQSKIKIIRGRENIGFPGAVNRAAARGNSPLIFLLNSDVIMEKDALDHMARAMDDPKVGVAGMKLLFPTEFPDDLVQEIRPAGKVQHVGIHTDIRGNFPHSFLGWSADNPKVLAQKEVYAVTGAAFMTRRSIWAKLRGMDEIYAPGTWEDIDFCMQVRKMEYNIVVVQEAVGTHYVGATAEKYRLGYPLERNRLTFLQRWQPEIEWWEGRIL